MLSYSEINVGGKLHPNCAWHIGKAAVQGMMLLGEKPLCIASDKTKLDSFYFAFDGN